MIPLTRTFHAGTLVAALLLVAVAGAAERPNILLILADDLGYGDLGCFGHPEIKTPHLDRLAQEGLKLTACYAAAANCSPARTGLLTGRTPFRVGIYNAIPMMSPMHLPATEVTIATLLRGAGYDTAVTGKWHLNGLFNLPGQPQPGDHGFNHWFAVQNNALPNHRNPYNFVRNGIPLGPIEGYAGPIVASEAVDWLVRGRDKARPFFLYVSFNEPHEPIATDPQFSAPYQQDHANDPSRVAYYGNVTQMDAAIGRILDTLDEQGLAANTLVIFTSDNGPARTRWHNAGSSGGFREFKGSLYEGGIRVPGIVRWPGRVKPGTVSAQPISGVDLLPTLCAITGIAPPSDRALDGANFIPALEGGRVRRNKPLYWQFLRTAPHVAIREGRWKLTATFDGPPPTTATLTETNQRLIKQGRLTRFELYDLETDPGEKIDLAATSPAKLAELKAVMERFHSEVSAEAPVWPLFDDPGYEARRIEWPDYTAKPLPQETTRRKRK